MDTRDVAAAAAAAAASLSLRRDDARRSVRRFYSWSGPTPRLRLPSRRCHAPATSDGSQASACESVRADVERVRAEVVVVGDVRTRRATESRAWTTTGRRRRRRRRRCRRRGRAKRARPSTRFFSATGLGSSSVASGPPARGRVRRDHPRLISHPGIGRIRNVGWLLSYGTLVRGVATRREAPPEAEVARLRSPSRRGIGSTNVTGIDRLRELSSSLSLCLLFLSILIVTGERRSPFYHMSLTIL